MTKLDEKALEAAFKYHDARDSDGDFEIVAGAIRAYLDALPPATVKWARPDILKTAGVHLVHKWASYFHDREIIQIEIRDIRS